MATAAEMIAELEAAIGSGVKNITVDGQSITYRDFSEMQSALEYFQRQIRTTKTAAFYPYYDRGL